MKRGLSTRAFTIIEVMIVLAVSSALLISAIVMIGGQQRKTEFNQSVNDIQSRINDIINDVSTGFYPNTDNFYCDGGSSPQLHSGSSPQGTNKDCIFIGRVIQFGPNNGQDFNVFTVVGLRQSGGSNVTSLAAAKPVAIAPTPTSPNLPSNLENRSLLYGLYVPDGKMTYSTAASTVNIGAFGVFTNFSTTNLASQGSGNASINIIPISSSLGDSAEQVANNISSVDEALKNPSGGITVCLQSSGTDQYGQLVIGGNSRQLGTDLTIHSGSCP